ncbi:hypothetical protein [Sphingobium abikonense]|uniref:hypothetical protein n=1 Tax=Sphingobium abikonense TaxID=86193 RepID=UPI0035115F9A
MAMFGALGKKRSAFDFSPGIYQTPGIGDGLPANMGEPGLGMTMAQPAPRASNFGARDVIGIIGDALSAAGGGQGVYTQMELRDREIARQQQQMQMQRQQGMQDWLAKQQWERENPAPRAPHYWEMNDGSLGVVGPDGKPQVLFKDPTPKINWIRADNGDGTQSLIPVGPNGPIGVKGGDPAISPSPGAASNLPAIGSIVADPRKAGAGSGQRGFRP